MTQAGGNCTRVREGKDGTRGADEAKANKNTRDMVAPSKGGHGCGRHRALRRAAGCLQEVVRRAARDVRLALARSRIELDAADGSQKGSAEANVDDGTDGRATRKRLRD